MQILVVLWQALGTHRPLYALVCAFHQRVGSNAYERS